MIFLKDLLSEAEIGGRNVQVYLDMDGVLADMEHGFEKLSGGVSTKDFAKVRTGGNQQKGQAEFWKLIHRGGPAFWSDLPPMPDAMVLWKFFKPYKPVILSAGQGSSVVQGKTDWCHKHLGSDINPIIARRGIEKPNYITKDPNTVHVLIDDTQKNIDAWNDTNAHRVAIHHKNAADSIRKFSELYLKDKSTP